MKSASFSNFRSFVTRPHLRLPIALPFVKTKGTEPHLRIYFLSVAPLKIQLLCDADIEADASELWYI